jgi:uncharacterized protein involved in exopolysaccharide biosynthesis/Mrp family chromosome partitioning ATPase
MTGSTRTFFTLRDLVIAAVYHRRVMLFAFLLPVLIAGLAALGARTTFDVEARLMVLFSKEQTGAQDLLGGPSILSIDGLKATETESGIMLSQEVVEEMVQEMGATTLFPELARPRFFGILPPVPEEQRQQKAIDLAKEAFRAESPTGSNLVLLTFRHENRDIGLKSVDTLIDIYLERRHKIYDNPRSPTLASETAGLLDRLRRTEQEIHTTKQKLDVLDLAQETVLAVNQIDSIIQRQRQLSERRAALVAEIATARARLAALPNVVYDFTETNDRVDNDEARNRAIQLEIERRRLLERYQPDHPRVQEVQAELAKAQEIQARRRTPAIAQREVRNPAIPFMTNQLLILDVEAEAIGRQIAELDNQRLSAEKRVQELRAAEPVLAELERSRLILSDSYREYNRRAEAARMEEDASRQRNANVRIIEWANAATAGKNLARNLLAGGVAGGLLLAGLAGLAAAYNRQVIVVPQEAEQRLGLPVQAVFDDHPQGMASPRNQQETMFLATRLLDVDHGDKQLRVIQIAGPTGADDRAGLAAALAEEIAGGHGRSILLLDIAGRDTAALASRFNARREDAVRPTDDLPLIAPTGTAGLYLAFDVEKSALGQPRTDRRRLRDAVGHLQGSYDILLLVAPLLHVNRLALRLAPVVDATVLSVHAEVTRLPAAQSLCEELLAAGGDLLGCVVTHRRYYIPRAIYRWL